uniref:Uncharacterized protein n=1 Tax=Sinocyclocheilus grahami TaxID=75366 RepID=A0A672KHM5_SINGR
MTEGLEGGSIQQLTVCERSVCEISHKTDMLTLTRESHGASSVCEVRKLKETLVTVQQLDKNMSNLRTWLSRVEGKLAKPIIYSVCHSDEIQRKLAEHQVICAFNNKTTIRNYVSSTYCMPSKSTMRYEADLSKHQCL